MKTAAPLSYSPRGFRCPLLGLVVLPLATLAYILRKSHLRRAVRRGSAPRSPRFPAAAVVVDVAAAVAAVAVICSSRAGHQILQLG